MHSDQSGLELYTRTFESKTYERCWSGKPAARWLVTKKHARDVASAVLIGNLLIRGGFVRHVGGNTSASKNRSFDPSPNAWYQFIEAKVRDVSDGDGAGGGPRQSCATNGASKPANEASMASILADTKESTSKRLYGESPEELLRAEGDEVDRTSATGPDGKKGDDDGGPTGLLARIVDSFARITVNALGWPFSLHVVSTVSVGVACVSLFTDHPTRNFLILSPLLVAWLYAVEREVRRDYIRRLQNSVWKAISVDTEKTFESETGLWFNRVLGRYALRSSRSISYEPIC